MLHRDETYRVLAVHLIAELDRIEERLHAADTLHHSIHDLVDVPDHDCPVEAPLELAIRAVREARRECSKVVNMQIADLHPIGDIARLWRDAAALDDQLDTA